MLLFSAHLHLALHTLRHCQSHLMIVWHILMMPLGLMKLLLVQDFAKLCLRLNLYFTFCPFHSPLSLPAFALSLSPAWTLLKYAHDVHFCLVLHAWPAPAGPPLLLCPFAKLFFFFYFHFCLAWPFFFGLSSCAMWFYSVKCFRFMRRRWNIFGRRCCAFAQWLNSWRIYVFTSDVIRRQILLLLLLLHWGWVEASHGDLWL